MKIGCVLLAAGNARRFGSNKLQVQVDGESLIRRALETVPSGLVTVVVSQYPEILSLAGEYGFEAVLNDQPDLGLSRSVRLGLERLTDCDGVLFLVADQPWLKRDSALGSEPSEDRRHGPRRRPGQSLPLSRPVLPGASGPQWGPGRQRRHPQPRGRPHFVRDRRSGADGH